MNDETKSQPWDGTVQVVGPTAAVDRSGKPRLRHGHGYEHGVVWAIDRAGKRAGKQTFDVYPSAKVVSLDNAGMSATDGENGEDNRGQGGGRAMLDELDRLYPEPQWWLASSEGALHTQDGIVFMRRRERPDRRKVHTETCALSDPRPTLPCGCYFNDRPEGDGGSPNNVEQGSTLDGGDSGESQGDQ